MKTAQDIISLIREKEIRMVDFKMVDIHGQFRHVTIPAADFNEEMMVEGVGFDASNYGYAVVEKSDMVFIPDPDTAVIDPFCSIPTLSMTGNAMIIALPVIDNVGMEQNGSITAVSGSGIKTMSLFSTTA